MVRGDAINKVKYLVPHYFQRETMRFFNQTMRDFHSMSFDGVTVLYADSIWEGKLMGISAIAVEDELDRTYNVGISKDEIKEYFGLTLKQIFKELVKKQRMLYANNNQETD